MRSISGRASTENRRRTILAAALACFAEHGYEATTLGQIRERSGASVGSIYHLFASKEEIAGAVSVPFYDPDPYVAALPHNAWLVCYCSCPHAESGQLAQKLASKGFPKVTVLEEGIGVWRARNYGTRSGWEP